MDNNDMEKARDEIMMRIKCLHCLKTFVDPRQLPCGHSFCFSCLEEINSNSVQRGSFGRHRTSTTFSRRSGGYFLCPTCVTLVSVPILGVSGFPQAPSVDDVKKSAIDELSKLLQIKYRRRTTGNIGHFDLSRGARSGEDLLFEENEEENHDEKNIHNRHSYPSSRLSNTLECTDVPIIETNENIESSKIDRESLPQLERMRRSRRNNRNFKSNLRPTTEYSDVSPKIRLNEDEILRENNNKILEEPLIEEEVDKDTSTSFDSRGDAIGSSKSNLMGSRSFSNLDQNKCFVSTTRRSFSLRDKIRRDIPHRYSDVIDPTEASNFSNSSFPSSSRSSFESRTKCSSSFDSNNGDGPSSYSDVGTSLPHIKAESTRYKSAPENFSNFSFKTKNGIHKEIIDETPSTTPRRSFRNYSNGLKNPFKDNQADLKEHEPKLKAFTEDEIKERILKYRETPEDLGSAKLVRVSDEVFCLPSAISCLPNKCLAVADHGSSSVLLFDRSWTNSRKIGGIKPFGLAYSEESGVLYATDRRSKTVLMYDAITGNLRSAWPSNAFSWICSVAVIDGISNSEQLAVLDRSTSSVKICDVQTGNIVRQFGSYGNDDDQFCMAEFLAWDPRRECLFVSDSGNHRIVAFDPRQGTPCYTFGQRGFGDDGCLQWPKGICLDERSYLYVADSGNKRVSRFTVDGCFIDHVVNPINSPYTMAIETNVDKSTNGTFLNLTTFSLQNKAQLFRYSI